jgi:hypothetical protein
MERGSGFQFQGLSKEEIQAEIRWRRLEHCRKAAN